MIVVYRCGCGAQDVHEVDHVSLAPPKRECPNCGKETGGAEVRPVRIQSSELREQIATVLDMAEAGGSFEVTRHGRLVALILPTPQSATKPDRTVWMHRARVLKK